MVINFIFSLQFFHIKIVSHVVLKSNPQPLTSYQGIEIEVLYVSCKLLGFYEVLITFYIMLLLIHPRQFNKIPIFQRGFVVVLELDITNASLMQFLKFTSWHRNHNCIHLDRKSVV